MVRKLDQSTILQLVKLIFNGLMLAVAFADFFRSMMAFTAIFSYLSGRVRLTTFNTKVFVC